MSNLPMGWEGRTNQMSEKDIQLGGVAATKFASKTLKKSAYEDDDGGAAAGVYKSSDQVRAFYLKEAERTSSGRVTSTSTSTSTTAQAGSDNDSVPKSCSLPPFWETRERERDLQAKQYGVEIPTNTQPPMVQNQNQNQNNNSSLTPAAYGPTPSTTSDYKSPEVALVKLATHTLETLAATLEHSSSGVKIPMEEKATFAQALKRVMDVMAKSG